MMDPRLHGDDTLFLITLNPLHLNLFQIPPFQKSETGHLEGDCFTLLKDTSEEIFYGFFSRSRARFPLISDIEAGPMIR